MDVENKFQKWASGFSGCDGGDIGCPDRRSTWICGIEWGRGHDRASLEENIPLNVGLPPIGYENPSENLAHIFNRQTMKLLTAMQGGLVSDYAQFAERERPFVEGCSGFFKMNLFPIAFKDTKNQRWQEDFSDLTGFTNKFDYLAWCRKVRFSKMRLWVAEYKPKVIVCFGKSLLADFENAFVNGTATFTKETILNRELSWARTQDGVLLAVCPFPVNRYGLNSNVLLQGFGDRIRELMNV